MSPWYAMALAPLTQPWGLVAAGVATITEAKLSSWADYLAIIGFCLIATGIYIVMELYVGFRPEEGQALLTRLRTWMDTHTDQVIIVVSLVLGLWLVGKSAYLLVT
jgi:heme/copper-type cytochrome/quinol oxidase subunit 4